MEQLSTSASTLLALKNCFLIPGLRLMNYPSMFVVVTDYFVQVILVCEHVWFGKSDSCAFPDYSEDSTCYVTMWKRQLFANDTNITHCVKSERAAVDFPSGSCHILHTL